MAVSEDYAFSLCLTHDVDRVAKTYQPVYYALVERQPDHLLDLLPGRNPYWQFEDIMALETELGVRSVFYFLNEQYLFRDKPLREWLSPRNWMLYVGRYSIWSSEIVEIIRELDEGGWEVGLHGSYASYEDPARLAEEKRDLERVLGKPVHGGRQHYLNLDRPRTWKYQSDSGLCYDSTLGSTTDYGFQGRYEPIRPFDDEFVVFPLTLMELTLPDVESNPERAWSECELLLEEARANEAVMTILWHQCYFSARDYPNYRSLYRRLVERALEMGAWVGSPGALYDSLDHPDAAVCDDEGNPDRTARPGTARDEQNSLSTGREDHPSTADCTRRPCDEQGWSG